jgi:NAD(P)-dependent dehydrogenase (short-subunit alcohol dehydrogenase family)
MDLHLQGTRVVVTGAGAGIGLAITRAFVEEDSYVVAGSRSSTDSLDSSRKAGR